MGGKEDGMEFSERVRRKIEERQKGRSAFANARAEAEAQLRARTAPLMRAVSALIARVSEDAAFRDPMGQPAITLDGPHETGSGSVTVRGRAATLTFSLRQDGRLGLVIWVKDHLNPDEEKLRFSN